MLATAKTTIRRHRLAGCLLQAAVCLLPLAFTRAQTSPVAAHIEAGRQLYAGSCGTAYCHGSEGKGGGAPALRERVFRVGYLRTVLRDGITDTAMPGYSNRLTPEEINQLVAYLLALSPGKGDRPEQAFATKPTPAAATPTTTGNELLKPATNSANESRPGLQGEAHAGQALFFDSASPSNCGGCHSVNGSGGKVASDLNRLQALPPRQLLQTILAPRLNDPARYGLWALTTRRGEKYLGIKRAEDAAAVHLYDTGTLPPSSRSFLKADIAQLEPLNQLACPGGYAAKYTLKQLLDLLAFLKTADLKNPARVSFEDLF